MNDIFWYIGSNFFVYPQIALSSERRKEMNLNICIFIVLTEIELSRGCLLLRLFITLIKGQLELSELRVNVLLEAARKTYNFRLPFRMVGGE